MTTPQIRFARFLIAGALLASYVEPALAIALGQVDDFEDGTTAGWSVGTPSPNPPTNVTSDGPAGVDDSFLRLTSIGSGGPGSRLISFNRNQWTGDYITTGVAAIALDLRNSGTSPLKIRVSLQGSNSGRFSSITPIELAAGADWANYTLPIGPSDLSALGSGVYSDVLSNVAEMRILSSPSPNFIGEAINAVLDVDNITAVPEPTYAMSVVVLSLTAIIATGRRRSTHWE